MNSKPDISVVIATHNRRALLERTLPTVVDQDLSPERYEVIVILDGCTDGTADFLSDFKTKCEVRFVVQDPNQGQSKAANAGARAARGKYLLFLDDDLLCERSLLRMHLEGHESKDFDVLVYGANPVSDESPETLATEWTRQSACNWHARVERDGAVTLPDDACVDANSSISREIFLECGGFDETFLSARQNEEFGLRLWHRGLRFIYAPAGVAHHIYLKSNFAYAVTEARAYGRAEVRMARKLPYARAKAVLPAIFSGFPGKSLGRRFLIGMPFSLEPLLRPACAIAQSLSGVSIFRRLGLKILSWRRAIVFERAAAREAGGLKVLKSELGAVLPVLMYHHIGPSVPGTHPDLTVTPAQFERQLGWLKSRGYTAILPTDWLDYVSLGKALPKRPLLLTFDDAYADLAEYCFPLLEKYSFKAVVFVPTAEIGGTNTWDQPIWPEPHKLLSAEQIRFWSGRGIEFGAHSRTHPDLTKLSVAECEGEIVGSKSDLAAVLGRPIVSFAYPFGENHEASRKIVRQEFGLGFGTEEGMNNLRSDRHLLRRIYIGPNDSLLEFALFVRLDGAKRVRDRLSRFRIRTRLKNVFRWIGRPFSRREQPTSR